MEPSDPENERKNFISEFNKLLVQAYMAKAEEGTSGAGWLAVIKEFTEKLPKENLHNYAAWHLVNGGTPPTTCTMLDLPEPHSIKAFLAQMLPPEQQSPHGAPQKTAIRPVEGRQQAPGTNGTHHLVM